MGYESGVKGATVPRKYSNLSGCIEYCNQSADPKASKPALSELTKVPVFVFDGNDCVEKRAASVMFGRKNSAAGRKR